MIKLYREEKSTQADIIEAEFRDLALGYDRVLMNPKDAQHQFGDNVSLPVLTDNARIVSGEEIPAYVQELTELVHSWRRFQSDCCYIDDDGETL
ncbi:MAG: hypothetical protein QM730_00070 [Anaerolineales bacterium]